MFHKQYNKICVYNIYNIFLFLLDYSYFTTNSISLYNNSVSLYNKINNNILIKYNNPVSSKLYIINNITIPVTGIYIYFIYDIEFFINNLYKLNNNTLELLKLIHNNYMFFKINNYNNTFNTLLHNVYINNFDNDLVISLKQLLKILNINNMCKYVIVLDIINISNISNYKIIKMFNIHDNYILPTPTIFSN
jgi:hypothetical protein